MWETIKSWFGGSSQSENKDTKHCMDCETEMPASHEHAAESMGDESMDDKSMSEDTMSDEGSMGEDTEEERN